MSKQAKKKATGKGSSSKAKSSSSKSSKAAKGKAKGKASSSKGKASGNGMRGAKGVIASLFASKSAKHTRAHVIKAVKDAGGSEATAVAYISWAKRKKGQGKHENPFGFRLDTSKDDAGKVIVKRVV